MFFLGKNEHTKNYSLNDSRNNYNVENIEIYIMQNMITF